MSLLIMKGVGGAKLHRHPGNALIPSLLALIPALSRSASGLTLGSILCLALTTCAAPRGYDREYRNALSAATIKGAEEHLKRGDAFERAGNLQLAYKEYRAAFLANPFQDAALLKRDLVRMKIAAESTSPKLVAAPAIPPTPLTAEIASTRQSTIPAVTILLDPMEVVVPMEEELSVRVVASGAITGAMFDLTMDPSVLSVLRVDPSPGAGDDFQALTREGGVTVSSNDAEITDGLLCTIVLKALTQGSSVLRIINARASDGDGKPLRVEPLSASVRIAGPEDDSI